MIKNRINYKKIKLLNFCYAFHLFLTLKKYLLLKKHQTQL